MIHYLVRVIGVIAPRSMHDWAKAMQAEIAAISDPHVARRYALGCLWAALILRVRATADAYASERSSSDVPSRLLFVQVNCGLGAAAIGVLYLVAGKAPTALVVVNTVATLIGVLLLFASIHVRRLPPRLVTATTVGIAVVLLLTALYGIAVDGASRWVQVGPLFVQTSLVCLPLALVLFARTPNGWNTASMIAAAIAVALQPDRAMAAALCAGLLALLVVRRTPAVATACGAAAAAVLVTCLQADRLPAVPFVDHILWSSFRMHPMLGAAMWAGSGLLFLPVLVVRSASARPERLAFGVCWAAIVGAAAVGAYPTPVVGYGGAAILGYFLSLAALGTRTTDAHEPAQPAASLPGKDARGPERNSGVSRASVYRGAVTAADAPHPRHARLSV